MRNLIVFVILALAVAATVQAAEPQAGQLSVTAGGGINMPSGDEAKNGYIVGAGLGVHVTRGLVLGGEVSYFGYSKEKGTDDNLGTPIDYSVSQHFFTYTGVGRYYFSGGKSSPYVKGFAGRFNYSLDAVFGGFPIEDSFSDLQFGGGIGMIFRGARESNLYVEALFNRMTSDEDDLDIFTITMGMDLGFRP